MINEKNERNKNEAKQMRPTNEKNFKKIINNSVLFVNDLSVDSKFSRDKNFPHKKSNIFTMVLELLAERKKSPTFLS